MAIDLKLESPDASFPAGAFLFGADSQAAVEPSVYRDSVVAAAIELIKGGYLTTMLTTNTGAQNATALSNDHTFAGGRQIIIPFGTHTISGGTAGVTSGGGSAAIDITDGTLRLKGLPGSVLQIAAGVSRSTETLFWFRNNCTVEIDGVTVDGNNVIDVVVRNSSTAASGGSTFKFKDIDFYNIGFTDIAGVQGTAGLMLSNASKVTVDGYKGRNIKAKKNGTGSGNVGYGDQPGKVNYIQIFNSTHLLPCLYDLNRLDFDTAGTNGDDVDHIHWLDQSTTGNIVGTLRNSKFVYDHNTRRVFKYQGGRHIIKGCFTERSSTFVPYAANYSGITVTSFSKANPGVITTNGSPSPNHGIAFAVPVSFVGSAGSSGTDWSGLNGVEFYWVPTGATIGNLYTQAGALLDTSAFAGTYTADSATLYVINGCGTENMSMLDWAGGTPTTAPGFVLAIDCDFDWRGFTRCIAQTTGLTGQNIFTRDCTIRGDRYGVNRPRPGDSVTEQSCTLNNGGNSANSNTEVVAFLTNANDVGSSMEGCTIWYGGNVFVPQGSNNRFCNNTLIDPRNNWISSGTTAKDGLTACDNDIITITPYSLNSSVTTQTATSGRMGNIRAWTNVDVSRNKLREAGNTLHHTKFIDFITSGATGRALDNLVPSGSVEVTLASGATVLMQRPQKLSSATPVSNSGTGADNDLISLTLTSGALNIVGQEVTARFTGASISSTSTKVVKLIMGSTTLGTLTLTASQVSTWEIECQIFYTGASTQRYEITLIENGTVSQRVHSEGTATVTSSGTIAIKTTGNASGASPAAGDITCNTGIIRTSTGFLLV